MGTKMRVVRVQPVQVEEDYSRVIVNGENVDALKPSDSFELAQGNAIQLQTDPRTKKIQIGVKRIDLGTF